jgi:hypothetical protein
MSRPYRYFPLPSFPFSSSFPFPVVFPLLFFPSRYLFILTFLVQEIAAMQEKELADLRSQHEGEQQGMIAKLMAALQQV